MKLNKKVFWLEVLASITSLISLLCTGAAATLFIRAFIEASMIANPYIFFGILTALLLTAIPVPLLIGVNLLTARVEPENSYKTRKYAFCLSYLLAALLLTVGFFLPVFITGPIVEFICMFVIPPLTIITTGAMALKSLSISAKVIRDHGIETAPVFESKPQTQSVAVNEIPKQSQQNTEEQDPHLVIEDIEPEDLSSAYSLITN